MKRRLWMFQQGETLLTCDDQMLIDFGYTREQLEEMYEAQATGPPEPIFRNLGTIEIDEPKPLTREDFEGMRKLLGLDEERVQLDISYKVEL